MQIFLGVKDNDNEKLINQRLTGLKVYKTLGMKLYGCNTTRKTFPSVFITDIKIVSCFSRHKDGKIELWVRADEVHLDNILKDNKIEITKPFKNEMLIGVITDGSSPAKYFNSLKELHFGYISCI